MELGTAQGTEYGPAYRERDGRASRAALSALQTARTLMKLLHRRLRRDDDIGLELADNVLLQLEAAGADLRQVGAESLQPARYRDLEFGGSGYGEYEGEYEGGFEEGGYDNFGGTGDYAEGGQSHVLGDASTSVSTSPSASTNSASVPAATTLGVGNEGGSEGGGESRAYSPLMVDRAEQYIEGSLERRQAYIEAPSIGSELYDMSVLVHEDAVQPLTSAPSPTFPSPSTPASTYSSTTVTPTPTHPTPNSTPNSTSTNSFAPTSTSSSSSTSFATSVPPEFWTLGKEENFIEYNNQQDNDNNHISSNKSEQVQAWKGKKQQKRLHQRRRTPKPEG